MSFKETDFPGLISYLRNLVQNEDDPVLFKETVSRLVKMYDKLPLYPGIINMCMGKVAVVGDSAKNHAGEQVYLRTDEGFASGTVKAINKKKIVLKDATVLYHYDEVEVEHDECDKSVTFNDNVVKELWPSLCFDKEEK